MSQFAEIAAIAGATVADVVRVATHGGTTRADWDIAYAIAQVTDQDPYRFMLTATRRGAAARIWADSREEEPPARTNPKAVHDPQVRIYEEPTAPDAPNTVLPDHPHEAPEPEEAERSEAEAFIAPLHRTLARYSRSLGLANKALRIVGAASGLAAARRALYRVLAEDPRTSLFGLHPSPEVALAA